MDINKEFIYNYQIENNKKILELLKNTSQLVFNNISFFAGCKKGSEDKKYGCDLLVADTNKEQEMNYTIRSDGRYVKTININNKRKYIYGNTVKELKEKYYLTKKNLKAILNKQINNNIKIKDWLIEWYKTFKEKFISQSSQQEILRIINNELKVFHNICLNKLDTETIQKYFNKIKKSRTKEKTILYFKASITKAFELGKIKLNPFGAFIKEKKIKKIRPPFTYDEQVRILKRLEFEEIRIPILIYILTGLRKHELDFKNIQKNIDYINHSLKAINLKQREDEPSYKVIDLTQGTIDLITNNIELINSYNEEQVYRKFNKILKELKINGGIHTLRHTFATNHLYLKTPIKIISNQLGHSTTQITQDIYLGLDKNITKEKINKLYNNLYVNYD